MDERRHHDRRPQPPLYVKANGRVFESHDWSEGNLMLDVDGAYRVGTLVTINAVGLAKKTMTAVEIRGRVERVTAEGAAAVNFLHRDDQAALILRELVDGL